MIDPVEWAWFDEAATGDVDHLLIGSSLPVLLPAGLHQLESWNEALCDGAWGPRGADQREDPAGIDLEHWGAFRALVRRDRAGRRDRGRSRGKAPATVVFMSGDVHYSYLARVAQPRAATRIYQVVCSPIRNPLARTVRLANGAASFGGAGLVGRALAKAAGVPKPAFSWKIQRGPFFHNALATLDLDGREATLRYNTGRITKGDPPPLDAIAEERLDPPHSPHAAPNVAVGQSASASYPPAHSPG